MSARKFHLVVDNTPDSDREVSGVHSNASLVTTAKIPKAQLDLLRQMRDEADAAHEANEAPTVMASAPVIPAGIPSPLGDDELLGDDDVESVRSDRFTDEAPTTKVSTLPSIPPPLPKSAPEPEPSADHTVVMRYSAVPQLPVVIATPPQFISIVGAPVIAPAAIEAARIAREEAQKVAAQRSRTKWVVVAIWATAFAIAGSLGWIIANDHPPTPAPVVTE